MSQVSLVQYTILAIQAIGVGFMLYGIYAAIRDLGRWLWKK